MQDFYHKCIKNKYGGKAEMLLIGTDNITYKKLTKCL